MSEIFKNERIVRDEIITVYLELGGESFGYYRVRPGKEPYICLATELLTMPQDLHLTVFQALLDYHRAIPVDSCYRLFEMTRYFEELIPEAVASPALAVEGPEIIIFARASRRWKYPVYFPNGYRMIGS